VADPQPVISGCGSRTADQQERRAMGRFPPGAVSAVAVLAAACVSCAGQPGARRPAPIAAVTTVAFGGTDAAWTQLMIPMTAQALRLLQLTALRASDARLARLATQLGTGYRGDLQRLRTALGRAGLAPTTEHDGHDLPGMVTPGDLQAIGTRTGPAFDAAAAAQLREEMEQSIRLARSEQRAGRSGDCRAIAASIEKARTGSLGRLNAVIRA
jgi:uncharacterized protein (DUF305 family)